MGFSVPYTLITSPRIKSNGSSVTFEMWRGTVISHIVSPECSAVTVRSSSTRRGFISFISQMSPTANSMAIKG